MQNVLNHVSDRSFNFTGKRRKKIKDFQTDYTALSYDVIYDVFVLFTSAKVEVILFDTFVTDQSLALLHVLHIN